MCLCMVWSGYAFICVSGEVRRLYIPAVEAYGTKGFPARKIAPDSDLLFEIEVLEIND